MHQTNRQKWPDACGNFRVSKMLLNPVADDFIALVGSSLPVQGRELRVLQSTTWIHISIFFRLGSCELRNDRLDKASAKTRDA